MNTYNMDDIARYADGLMPPEEQLAFEENLAGDATLRGQLALYREVHTALTHHFSGNMQQDQLQHTLLNLRSEFFSPTITRRSKVVSINRYLRPAMAVAAVVIVVLFTWRPWQPGLFQQYAATQMVTSMERGTGTDSLLEEAAAAFNREDFSTAARLLLTFTQQQPESPLAQFYYGVALLQTDQPSAARTVFSKLFEGKSVFKYEAAFYLALTYLKEGNKSDCRLWLQQIPSDAANYTKAQALLKKL